MLGPDYLFGVTIQNMPEADEALVKAVEAFPKWFDAVKAKYGEKTHRPSSFSCSSASF